MELFAISDIEKALAGSGERYLQFINAGSMSLGLYVLPTGSTDTQTPHEEDEIYYVLSGRATVEVAGERESVQPGTTIFVAKEVDHRFFDIEEDLTLLVFFAPQHAG